MLLTSSVVFAVDKLENICIAGLTRRAGYATDKHIHANLFNRYVVSINIIYIFPTREKSDTSNQHYFAHTDIRMTV